MLVVTCSRPAGYGLAPPANGSRCHSAALFSNACSKGILHAARVHIHIHIMVASGTTSLVCMMQWYVMMGDAEVERAPLPACAMRGLRARLACVLAASCMLHCAL
jgi:hypothetical protein